MRAATFAGSIPERRARSSASNSSRSICSAWGRNSKIPPPSLLRTTIRTGRRGVPQRGEPVHVVVEAEVAGDDPGRAAGCAAAAPTPEEIRPSIPFAPRLQRNLTCGRAGRRRTPPGRGSASTTPCRRARRPRRARRARRGRRARSARRGSRARASIASRPPRRRRAMRRPTPVRHAACPGGRASSASAGGDARRVGADDRLGLARGLVPAEARVDHHLPQVRRARRATPAAPCWSACRRTRITSSGSSVARAQRGRSRRRARRRASRSCAPRRSCEVGSARIG